MFLGERLWLSVSYGPDPDPNIHGQMVRRCSIPRTLQRDRLTRVSYSGNTDEILILRYTSRWIKIHPAWSRHIDLDPSVSVAASKIVLVLLLLIIIDQTYVSG